MSIPSIPTLFRYVLYLVSRPTLPQLLRFRQDIAKGGLNKFAEYRTQKTSFEQRASHLEDAQRSFNDGKTSPSAQGFLSSLGQTLSSGIPQSLSSYVAAPDDGQQRPSQGHGLLASIGSIGQSITHYVGLDEGRAASYSPETAAKELDSLHQVGGLSHPSCLHNELKFSS